MNSPASVSESSFERLHPEIRRWIRDEGWNELRSIQDASIRAIFDHDRDLVIAASTASGKTEAAFFPLLTRAAERTRAGVSILYVSPLKALINDQFRRLDQLCERLELPVVRWHGDAPTAAKRNLLKQPSGIILITPESIEALFLRRTTEVAALLGELDAIVIDELHAFLHGPRGLHLASLLRRIDRLGQRPRRIGLSATLGDFSAAEEWVSAGSNKGSAELVIVAEDQPELKLQIRGYIEPPEEDGVDELEAEGHSSALSQIADHLFSTLRGSNNLVFAGSRRTVEALADRLRRRSEEAAVPEEFFPHHGNLSKELRQELEERLKAGNLPTTAVATTTLELGIDLGSVKSVAQVGAPRSLASLRQRLGRSGRRAGTPAILRIYVREKHLSSGSDPLDRLRLDTVRAVASVRLLLEKFVEPPSPDPSLLTVALHQTLSTIVQHGGVSGPRLYHDLCEDGPFSVLTKQDFIALLRAAANPQAPLVEQSPDGLIMLGDLGERLTGGRDFYAVFESDQEWRLVTGGKTLGTIPIVNLLGIGSLVGFAGRRWRVLAVDDVAKVLEVVPHPSGRLPKFDRLSLEPIHDRLAQEMLSVYSDGDVPSYLDNQAQDLLSQGRDTFVELALERNSFIAAERDTHVLTWRGTIVNSILAVLITAAGLDCDAHEGGVTVTNAEPDELRCLLDRIGECPPLDDLAPFVKNIREAKFDGFLPDELLGRLWVQRNSPYRDEVSACLSNLRMRSTSGGQTSSSADEP